VGNLDLVGSKRLSRRRNEGMETKLTKVSSFQKGVPHSARRIVYILPSSLLK